MYVIAALLSSLIATYFCMIAYGPSAGLACFTSLIMLFLVFEYFFGLPDDDLGESNDE
jgi:hypothetical protein